MKYSEAKRVVEQQEAARAVIAKYEALSSLHKAHGFASRSELIQALTELDRGGRGRVGRGKGKKRGTRGLSPEAVEQIKKLKAEGKSNAAISRTTGISPLTVAKYVKGAPATKKTAKKAPGRRKKGVRGKRGLAPETIDQIKKLKGEGKSNAAISRALKVSPLTVAKYVKGQSGGTKAAPDATSPAAKPKRRKAGKAKKK